MGGRLQLHFLAPSQSAKKPLQSKGLNSGKARNSLSLTCHSGHMETKKPGPIVLWIIGIVLLLGWALVIWVCTIVTHTALETLAYIVDLAQMTP